MTPRRKLILALALAVAVALTVQSLMWTPGQDGAGGAADIVQPVARAQAATLHQSSGATAPSAETGGQTGNQGDSLQLRVRPAPVRVPRDLFAAYSWVPPPPPAPPPPAPQAPPLPFAYGGRMEIDGKSVYLLLQGVRTYRVVAGDSVGDFKLTSSNLEGLVFLHQPTGMTEVLAAPGLPIASSD